MMVGSSDLLRSAKVLYTVHVWKGTLTLRLLGMLQGCTRGKIETDDVKTGLGTLLPAETVQLLI